MKLTDVPSAENLPRYENPRLSGNVTNGLNVSKKIQAKRVFHALGYPNFPWAGMNAFFLMNGSLQILLEALKYRWKLRRSTGPVAEKAIKVADPVVMAAQIKQKAKELGAGIVGISVVLPEDLYDDIKLNYRYAICIGTPMQRDEMQYVGHARAALEVQRSYSEVGSVAIELAEYIRSLGWPAKAYGDPRSTDLLQIPMAIRAGLGELGKHGSLISKEYGSNFRLSSVVTDIPIAVDKYNAVGIDEMCLGCRRCTIDCPPKAITDKKQMVRGEVRWYVDFDKCVPYFAATHGCAICIEVCPWSEPGGGVKLSEIMMGKRAKKVNQNRSKARNNI